MFSLFKSNKTKGKLLRKRYDFKEKLLRTQEEHDAAVGGQASARLKRTLTMNSGGGLVSVPGRTSEPTRLRATTEHQRAADKASYIDSGYDGSQPPNAVTEHVRSEDSSPMPSQDFQKFIITTTQQPKDGTAVGTPSSYKLQSSSLE